MKRYNNENLLEKTIDLSTAEVSSIQELSSYAIFNNLISVRRLYSLLLVDEIINDNYLYQVLKNKLFEVDREDLYQTFYESFNIINNNGKNSRWGLKISDNSDVAISAFYDDCLPIQKSLCFYNEFLNTYILITNLKSDNSYTPLELGVTFMIKDKIIMHKYTDIANITLNKIFELVYFTFINNMISRNMCNNAYQYLEKHFILNFNNDIVSIDSLYYYDGIGNITNTDLIRIISSIYKNNFTDIFELFKMKIYKNCIKVANIFYHFENSVLSAFIKDKIIKQFDTTDIKIEENVLNYRLVNKGVLVLGLKNVMIHLDLGDNYWKYYMKSITNSTTLLLKKGLVNHIKNMSKDNIRDLLNKFYKDNNVQTKSIKFHGFDDFIESLKKDTSVIIDSVIDYLNRYTSLELNENTTYYDLLEITDTVFVKDFLKAHEDICRFRDHVILRKRILEDYLNMLETNDLFKMIKLHENIN